MPDLDIGAAGTVFQHGPDADHSTISTDIVPTAAAASNIAALPTMTHHQVISGGGQ